MSRSFKIIEESLGLDEINERLYDDRPDPTVDELISACREVVAAYEYGNDLRESMKTVQSAIWNAERRNASKCVSRVPASIQ